MLVEKFAAAGAPVTLYAKPELALAQRFAQEAYDGSFLATNPEIKVHLQYVNGG